MQSYQGYTTRAVALFNSLPYEHVHEGERITSCLIYNEGKGRPQNAPAQLTEGGPRPPFVHEKEINAMIFYQFTVASPFPSPGLSLDA